MMKLKLVCSALLVVAVPLTARNTILEFKGACQVPTNSTFRDIYGHAGALYGPELTVQLKEDKPWHAFASFDYFRKNGHSIGLCEPTTVKLLQFALGLKYFKSVRDGKADLYAGLAFEPVNMRTINCIQSVELRTSQWGFGGLAKIGAYYYLPRNFVFDFFIDYSFARVGSNDCNSCTGLQSVKANVSGAIFGIGLGYNFN